MNSNSVPGVGEPDESCVWCDDADPAGRWVTASTKGSTLSHGEYPSATLIRRGVEAFRRGDAAWIRQYVVDDIIWHVGGSTR
jgi:hypothetical protein